MDKAAMKMLDQFQLSPRYDAGFSLAPW